jgi:hypothetical protein
MTGIIIVAAEAVLTTENPGKGLKNGRIWILKNAKRITKPRKIQRTLFEKDVITLI